MSFQYELHICMHPTDTEIMALCRAFCCLLLIQFDRLNFRKNNHQEKGSLQSYDISSVLGFPLQNSP